MKCCNGLYEFGKCGRGLKKGCKGAHCRCMQKDCINMHYVDCAEHYIHVEYVENQLIRDALKSIFQKNIFDEITYIDRMAEMKLTKGVEDCIKEIEEYIAQIKNIK